MKIRSDYVSNSSSSSFIIDFEDKGACIDETFMSLIGCLKGFTLNGTCNNAEQLNEYREKARAVFGENIEDWSDENDLSLYISVDSKNIMAEGVYE